MPDLSTFPRNFTWGHANTHFLNFASSRVVRCLRWLNQLLEKITTLSIYVYTYSLCWTIMRLIDHWNVAAGLRNPKAWIRKHTVTGGWQVTWDVYRNLWTTAFELLSLNDINILINIGKEIPFTFIGPSWNRCPGWRQNTTCCYIQYFVWTHYYFTFV